MRISIKARAIGEEEIGAGLSRDGRLDARDRLSDGPELERADARRSEERSEDHVVPRGNANDVVDARVDPFHQTTTRPARPENHHSRFLSFSRRRQTFVPTPIQSIGSRRLDLLGLIQSGAETGGERG